MSCKKGPVATVTVTVDRTPHVVEVCASDAAAVVKAAGIESIDPKRFKEIAEAAEAQPEEERPKTGE